MVSVLVRVNTETIVRFPGAELGVILRYYEDVHPAFEKYGVAGPATIVGLLSVSRQPHRRRRDGGI